MHFAWIVHCCNTFNELCQVILFFSIGFMRLGDLAKKDFVAFLCSIVLLVSLLIHLFLAVQFFYPADLSNNTGIRELIHFQPIK